MDKDLIEAYRRASEQDLKLARKLLEEGEFYYAVVFFAQQAAEKIVKAFLAKKGITGIKRHDISGVLGRYMKERKIIKSLQRLESQVTKSRYPFKVKGRVVSPPEAYTEQEALNAVGDAKTVVEKLGEALDE